MLIANIFSQIFAIHIILYTSNLELRLLIPVFRLQNNYCEFITHMHKFKWLFCIKTKVLNVRNQDISDIQILTIIKLDTAMKINMYLFAAPN